MKREKALAVARAILSVLKAYDVRMACSVLGDGVELHDGDPNASDSFLIWEGGNPQLASVIRLSEVSQSG